MSEPDAPSPEPAPAEPSPPSPVTSRPEPAPARAYQSAGRQSRLGYLFFGGLLALVAGLLWRFIEPQTGVTTNVWIFVSLLAMLVPPAWHAVDLGKALASQRGAAFGYVVLTTTLALVVAVFVGWAISGPRTALLPTLDLTKSSRYSLSDESVKLLAKVNGTVYITYLMQGQGDEDLRADALAQLHVFETSSPRVKMIEVDALRNPEAASRALKENGVSTNTTSGEDADVIVLTYAEPGREVAPGKQKEIKVERWSFMKTSLTGADVWLGERLVSSGIYELVFQKYKAYATGGHGERSLGQDFGDLKDALTNQNIEVVSAPLNLVATPTVPKDCEILLVLGPTTPFTAEEADAVTRWLDQGRTLFVALDVRDERPATGLEALFDRFGLVPHTDYEVIAPQQVTMNINQEERRIPTGMGSEFPVYGSGYNQDHPAAKALSARGGLTTLFRRSSFVEIRSPAPEGAKPEEVCVAPSVPQMEPLALKHEPGRIDYRTLKPGDKEPGGKFPLVVTSTRKLTDAAEGRDARVVVSGDSDVFTDDVIAKTPANLDLARGLVQWGLRREGLVAVSDRTLENPYVTPTEYQKRFALGWPALGWLLPLIAGGMVWWSRRR